MSLPTLSVILPNFNHGRYVARAIEAVLSQSHPPEEFLILDDASTDNSVEIISSYAKRFSFIRFHRNERNEGHLKGMKKLLEKATGEWVYCGAADDHVLPGFFERSLAMAQKHPESALVFGPMTHEDPQGRSLRTTTVSQWSHDLYASPERFLGEYLDWEAPSHSLSAATMYRRETLQGIGWFPEDLASWCDSFAIRALGLQHGACYLHDPCVSVTMLPGAYSKQVGRDFKRATELVSLAASKMRSPAFRDVFPEDHVRRWERAYRNWILLNRALPFELDVDWGTMAEEKNLLKPTDGLDRLAIRVANTGTRILWSLLWRRVMAKYRSTGYRSSR